MIYNLVADVDNYYKFVPNVFESKVLKKCSPNLMEASLSIGIPNMIQAEYTSTIHLDKNRKIVIKSQPNDFAKFIQSEWKFEPISSSNPSSKTNKNTDKCLVYFNVEFELYSQVTANILNIVLDDFTRKTMQAFIKRAEKMHLEQQQQQHHQ